MEDTDQKIVTSFADLEKDVLDSFYNDVFLKIVQEPVFTQILTAEQKVAILEGAGFTIHDDGTTITVSAMFFSVQMNKETNTIHITFDTEKLLEIAKRV